MITDKNRKQQGEYSYEFIQFCIEDPDHDFSTVKQTVEEKISEVCLKPMLLAWFNEYTGEFSPKEECCGDDKPTWLIYAESRGANLRIEVNDGKYIFAYRCEALF